MLLRVLSTRTQQVRTMRGSGHRAHQAVVQWLAHTLGDGPAEEDSG